MHWSALLSRRVLRVIFAALFALLAALPTALPALAQEGLPPVAEDTAPPAEAPLEPAVPTGPLGFAALLDDRALLDRVEIRVRGLTPPPDGSAYRAWLRSDDETLTLLVGELAFDHLGDGIVALSQTAGEPFFIQFSQALVSLETGPVGALPGDVVLRGRVDPGALVHFRRLLVRWPDSRYGTASLQGLRQQSAAMHFHAAVLREAAALGDLETVRRKAEHVVNIVEGQSGGFFGDWNGDGRAEDPGDGVGFLSYGWGALIHTQFAWATALDETVAAAALSVQPPVQTGLEWAGFARQLALELAAPAAPLTPESALDLAGHLFTATERLVVAVDPRWSEALAAQALAEERVPAYETALTLLQLPLLPPGATTATAGAGQAVS